MEPMLVYIPRLTPRIVYIFHFIFETILGIKYELTTSRERVLKARAPVLSYSKEPLDKGIWIHCHDLLMESGYHVQDLQFGHWNKMMVPFFIGFGPDLPFDIFAAAFYMITRYEEYLEFTPDAFGRFRASQSQAYKHRFLHLPVVDLWALKLGQILQVRYPAIQIRKREYRFISTIDIDQAWAYKHKGLARNLGGTARSLVRGELSDPVRRLATHLGLRTDPYHTFEYIHQTHLERHLKPVFFVQIGKRGRWDKNISGKHPAMQRLVKQLQTIGEVGLHPSLRSGRRQELDEELVLFSELTRQKTVRSRQHFIRLVFPHTYQLLCQYGVTHDHSMGFHDMPGFRAGTATPFYFFDLTEDQQKDLRVYPFQFMDVTLKDYLRLGPQDAMLKIEPIIEQVRKVGGTLASIWHNSALSETGDWKQWKPVFDYMMEKASP